MLHCIYINYSAESSSGQDHILKKTGNKDYTCDGKEISKRKGRKIEYKCDGKEISWELFLIVSIWFYSHNPYLEFNIFYIAFY